MTSNLPPRDPYELMDFPSVTWEDPQVAFRIHLADNEAAYFGDRGIYRFDAPHWLTGRQRYGTCYLAQSPVGAFLETLGEIRPLAAHLVNERVISELVPSEPFKIADLTDESVVGRYGIFGDLSAGDDYALTQEWGAALQQAGFQGVQYRASHHPQLNETSIALFGPAGVNRDLLKYLKDDGEPEPIYRSLLEEVRDRFDVEVIPAVAW
ncbi:RES family NAD+ phosphorylase [Streptomyces griseorubiginosus]|uniref:RES family NAD+ phosphorylase n=1 Tax=Streptomyces griseorubiginosus TaxID=67304 RepID=UPI002E81C065|nr:RES family NAD+ phosphorylase [Streptomyces griseorubiginosus]WUB43983.1 RES family NAD+ phosphorylase [Streptomyces griseorubiginosus]WUB52501.1 RES family NAD+ phosphorylase [Streptomyces griseorubiginosus]